MPPFQPTCSVVISTRSRAETLDLCLDAVAREDYPSFEIIVVDNSAGDAATREVAQRHQTRYLVEPVVGLSRARNTGSRAAKADIVAYLDDDALPETGWLLALMAAFEDPQVMACGGRIVAAKDSLVSSEIQDAKPGAAQVIDKATPDWFEIANFGGIGGGGNMAVRKAAFDFWPGFDERLGRGTFIDAGEESYAFFSLIDRGYRVAYTPHAIVTHPHHLTAEKLRSRYRKDFASATAYMTFLYWEEPAYRVALKRFVLDALRNKPRSWRVMPVASARSVPRWLLWTAQLAGPWLYLRTRLRNANGRALLDRKNETQSG